ncbi:MAG: hypothetical protein ACD_13C00221G0003 [uncultured bacterium]|nr:MAG: hypothetical protein ACD_13C00221G0003 [uncultured bacterium]
MADGSATWGSASTGRISSTKSSGKGVDVAVASGITVSAGVGDAISVGVDEASVVANNSVVSIVGVGVAS